MFEPFLLQPERCRGCAMPLKKASDLRPYEALAAIGKGSPGCFGPALPLRPRSPISAAAPAFPTPLEAKQRLFF
jgi:hypothetical protein